MSLVVNLRESLIAAGASGAELVIRALEQNSVDTVFGIPGVHTLALYDALRDSSIRHILARHEQGAGFMADGYARASGRPGVACVITGPGVTNISTAIGEAYTDSSPVLVISSNSHRAHIDDMRGSLHDLKDQMGVMAALTKWNARVLDADAVGPTMQVALQTLMTGRPLPVHVEFPIDVLDERSTRETRLLAIEPSPIEPDPSQIEKAVAALAGASRPIIYCGGGAISSGASTALTSLAERLNALVVTSIMGKGSVPEDHPLCAGALWEPGNAIDELVQMSDCLVVFGSKLGLQATYGFNLAMPPILIRVEIDAREMTLNAKPSIPILSDARLAAEAMVDALSRRSIGGPGFDHNLVARAKLSAEGEAFHIDRRAYVDALRRAIPRGGILTTDMTQLAYVACYLYPVFEPRTFMFPSGYGTLGFSLPAAIGAKVARPDTPVVAVIGDGGFQYTMAELGCAVQERIGFPVVIFNDSTYSAVKQAQKQSRGGRTIGVDLVNPDYVQLAKAYGIPGERVTSPEELEQAITGAFERDLPTIIDVPIEPVL